MTVTTENESQTTSQVVPIGLTITREAVLGLAKKLAYDLFPYVKDHYRYMSDSAGEQEFAKTIGNFFHVLLNQMRVDKRECKHCGRTQQDHEWVGGYCGAGNGQKFETGS
jgi:hypothetical protein